MRASARLLFASGENTRRVLRGFLVSVFAILIYVSGMQFACAGSMALLIGVGEYPHLPSKWQLDGPRNDVRLMKTFLINEWGFSESEVRSLLDKQATKHGILNAIGVWLPRVTSPGDRVVIYYSGHGSQVDDISGDEPDGKDETIVPNDYGVDPKCARESVAVRDLDDCAMGMILDDELADALDRLRERTVIVIADSCNSGTVTKGLRIGSLNAKARYFPFPTRTKSFVRTEQGISHEISAQLTLSAALPHQLAWEEEGFGVFTRLFVEGLTDMRADLNESGTVTTAELMNFIKPRAENWCSEFRDCQKRRLGFTPNLEPNHETYILQPLSVRGLQVVTDRIPAYISDILPALGSDTVTIDIDPSSSVGLGQRTSFTTTSAEDGYLTLFEFNANQKLRLLFPTREDLDAGLSDRIRSNVPLRVPNDAHDFEFTASEPVGSGNIIAIVTKDRVDLSSVVDRGRNYRPIRNKVALMKSISAQLYDVWTGDDENRGARWAVGYADYEISR